MTRMSKNRLLLCIESDLNPSLQFVRIHMFPSSISLHLHIPICYLDICIGRNQSFCIHEYKYFCKWKLMSRVGEVSFQNYFTIEYTENNLEPTLQFLPMLYSTIDGLQSFEKHFAMYK